MLKKLLRLGRIFLFLVLAGGMLTHASGTAQTALHRHAEASCLTMSNQSMYVPCARYDAAGYEFMFRYAINPFDATDNIWQIDWDSFREASSDSCIEVGSDLNMMIPCAIYGGVEHAFRLNYNSEGAYWSMVQERQPVVYQAGMAWDPEYAGGELSVPVIWKGVDAPTRLPMLNQIGNCEGEGIVQGMTLVEDQPVMAGFATVCIRDPEGSGSIQSMKPVIWQNGTITLLQIPSNHDRGMAYDIAYRDGDLFVVGSTGIFSPHPILWLNGYPMALTLPEDYNAGEARTIRIDGDDIYVSALISRGELGQPLDWATGYWKINAGIIDADWTFFPLPRGAQAIDAPVALAVSASTVWGIINSYGLEGPRFTKPALVQNDGAPVPLIDFNFDNEPYGSAYSLLWNGMQTITVGSIDSGEYGMPAPVQWNGQETMRLSTADDALNIGIAHSVTMLGTDVYASGRTYRRDAEYPHLIIEVPCYWKNGVRYDRQGFPVSGTASITPQAADAFRWEAWPVMPLRPALPQGSLQVSGSGAAVPLAIAVYLPETFWP